MTEPIRRLVIRVKILPEGSRAPVRRRLSRGALLLILGAAVALLSWLGISIFRPDPAPAPVATARTPNSTSPSPAPVPAPSEAAPVVRDEPPPKPATETAESKSVELESPTPIDEVIPDVPRSARETIRGTIRVTIRVIIDKEGTVLAASADEPGPSRYFERLAVEAAKKWTFTPTASAAQRVMLVRFDFTRGGTTGHASSLK